MTRINCVPVVELSNLHLLAEYRELPRISRLAKKNDNIPTNYCLGTGHVKFFYDKGFWLKKRFEEQIVPEMIKRGFKPQYKEYRVHPDGLNNDWSVTQEAIELNRARIKERNNATRA